MKKAAIFDMDGLMFDTESIWQEGWRIFAKEYGYEPSADFGKEVSGTSGPVMEAVIKKHYPNIDPPEFIKKERAYVESVLEKDVPIKPGLFEILDMFRSNRIPMAVASSSKPAMIRANLQKAGVEDYFTVILSSSQVASAKPEPDVFLEAARLLHMDPFDCYVFEDSYGGVRAGNAAGCTTVMIPDQLLPDSEISELCDGIYDSLSDACKAILSGDI